MELNLELGAIDCALDNSLWALEGDFIDWINLTNDGEQQCEGMVVQGGIGVADEFYGWEYDGGTVVIEAKLLWMNRFFGIEVVVAVVRYL